jgi:hypothetical protein
VRYVFIAGLEHSGTTLTDDLLSHRLGGIGLGEVARFLSPPHLQEYLSRWGALPDARICSCGMAWESCPFWGGLRPVWGLSGDQSLEERYGSLLERVRALYGEDAVVVDSSKSLAVLDLLLARPDELGLARDELRVVLAAKDVRSFAASVLGKRDSRKSMIAVARAFRWWREANRGFLSALDRSSIPRALSLYETLCESPDDHCARLAGLLGLRLVDPGFDRATESHIAIGNKDYLNHTRGRVRYDDRWRHDVHIRLVYSLMPGIRRFNRRLAERFAADGRRKP